MRRRTFLCRTAALAGITQMYPHIALGLDPPRTELTLCLDGSGSVYSNSSIVDGVSVMHHELQRRGHVDALSNPEVAQVLARGRVLLNAIIWSQPGSARLIAGPTLVENPDDALAFALFLDANMPRELAPDQKAGTYHTSALRYALQLPTYGGKRIIDVATDECLDKAAVTPCEEIRNIAESHGITINALAIDFDGATSVAQSMRASLQTSDGFTIPAKGWHEYALAIMQKLLQELPTA